MSRNPETPMRRIRENRTCDLPGPGDSHCTDHPAHDWSCYDARGDVSFNVRQGWTHRHPGCPDDGHVTADIGPVVKAVVPAKTLHGGTFAHRLPWSCLCGAIFRSVEDHHEHYRPEVAKAAMDAARPIIDAEAYARGWADATEVVEFQGQKVYRHQVMEMLPPNWADELTDTDDRSK